LTVRPVGGSFDKRRPLSLSKHRASVQRTAKTFFAFFAKNLDKIFPVRYGE
jgi:hypothetical protein